MNDPDINSILKCLDIDMLNRAKHYKVGDKIIVRVGNSDSGEPLRVTVVDDTTAAYTSIYNEELSVAYNSLTELISYTVAPGKVFLLENIEVSGDNIAKYTVTINGSVSKIKRASEGSGYNASFRYLQQELAAGDIVKIEVLHCQIKNESGDFNATIEGRLRNA